MKKKTYREKEVEMDFVSGWLWFVQTGHILPKLWCPLPERITPCLHIPYEYVEKYPGNLKMQDI
ncbi:MAG: hypothetical protein AB1847_07195 [bacterium]